MLTPYMPWYGYPTASISPLQTVMGQCRYGRQSDCSTLKWVLATASPQPSPLHGEGAEGEASVRQDQRQYCVLVLRTHPVGAVVLPIHTSNSGRRILFRPETHCVLVLRTHPVGSVVLRLFGNHPHYLLERTQNMLERWDGTSDTEVSSSGRRGEHEHRS